MSAAADIPIPNRFVPVTLPRRSSPSAPDRRLLRDLRRQDPRAVERITERYGALLRGYLGEVLADRGAVDDVLQLTLLDVWRRGPTFDPGRASLSTWLLLIARSRAVDHLRRRVPEPYDPESIAQFAESDGEDTAAALIERWRVAGLIATLPRQEARLLELRFYGGLTQREIAAQTGIPLGTVKMQMVRALERLRGAIEREETDG